MTESRPFVIYSLYFDASLTRSEGRRVSIRNAVRNPKTEEILKVARSICIRVERTSKNHPTSWSICYTFRWNYGTTKKWC